MRERRAARRRSGEIRVVKTVGFDPSAFEDLAWWAEQDRAQAIRIIRLVRDTPRDPFAGTGKPERLRHIRILACRYHY